MVYTFLKLKKNKTTPELRPSGSEGPRPDLCQRRESGNNRRRSEVRSK